jgi:hypothetical protein
MPSALALALILGCSSEDGDGGNGGGETCPHDYSKFDGTTPTVSFSQDVLPIFRRSCGISSVCHGDLAKSSAGLYMGPKTSAADPTDQERADVVAGLTQASATAPELKNVEPGDPANSFLMIKTDACQNAHGLNCTAQPGAESSDPCGDPMPQTGGKLPASERDIIRRWIAQGAQAD